VVNERAAQAKKKRLTVTWSTRCKRCPFGHPLTPLLTPLVPEMSVESSIAPIRNDQLISV
jgi:hypothetical protein